MTHAHGHVDFTRMTRDFLRSGNSCETHYITLTPPLAQDLLDRSRYGKQRPISKGNVAGFLEHIARQTFRGNTVIEACITPDGRMHLVDGQHRLTAIARQNQSLPVCLQLCFMQNDEAVQTRYDMHDSAGRPRNLRDRLGNIHEEIGISRKDAERLAVAVNHIRFGFTNDVGGAAAADVAKKVSRKDGEEVRTMMLEWASQARPSSA